MARRTSKRGPKDVLLFQNYFMLSGTADLKVGRLSRNMYKGPMDKAKEGQGWVMEMGVGGAGESDGWKMETEQKNNNNKA